MGRCVVLYVDDAKNNTSVNEASGQMNEKKYTVSAPKAVNVSAYYHIRELKFKKQKQYFSTFSSTSVKRANLCSCIPVLKKLNKSL